MTFKIQPGMPGTPAITILIFGVVCLILSVTTRADPPATQPAAAPATAPADTSEGKAVRQTLLGWDRNDGKETLQDFRKEVYTRDEKEDGFIDHVCHESWEHSKLQLAVRNKWGLQAEAKFEHYLGGATLEEDQVCCIQVDGDHAVLTWDDLPNSVPEHLIRIDGHWLVDGHVIYEDAVKARGSAPLMERHSAKLSEQMISDIAADRFDDFSEFYAEFRAKFVALPWEEK